MLLRYNFSSKLQGLDWCICEISHAGDLDPQENIELILRRLVESSFPMFGGEALEVFVPFQQDRTLMLGEYFFARSPNMAVLDKLRTIRGLAFIVKIRRAAVLVPDSYVQDLIAKAESQHRARWQGIACGTFVRIMDGLTRGYCGVVLSVKTGMANVGVQLFTRRLLITTPLGNLENLSCVPRANRVFYCQSKGARSNAS